MDAESKNPRTDCGRNRTARWQMALVAAYLLAAVISALMGSGCQAAGETSGNESLATGTTSADAMASTTTTEALIWQSLPDGVDRVVGVNAGAVWSLTEKGVAIIPGYSMGDPVVTTSDGSLVAVGSRGNGTVMLWSQKGLAEAYPRRLEVGNPGFGLGLLSMSPGGGSLAVVRLEPRDPAAEDFITHVYIVDVVDGSSRELDGLRAFVGAMDRVTALAWGPSADDFYFSVGPVGGSEGERTFRYTLATDAVFEIGGIATVMGVGESGMVLGAEAAEPVEPPLPAGVVGGSRPLSVWRDGSLERVPMDLSVRRWSRAWLAADENTVVVEVDVDTGTEVWRRALQTSLFDQGAWRLGHLVVMPGNSRGVLPGVGFACSPTTFWMQVQLDEETQGLPPGLWLGRVDTRTGQYRMETTVPVEGYTRCVAVGST